MAKPLMVFSYDITDDRLRRRVAKILSDRLVRVQRSVFEGRMTRDEAVKLAGRLARHLDRSDSLRVYCVTPEGLEASFCHSLVPMAESQEFWLL